MRVEVLPFGVLKDGLSATTLELPSGATVADLLQRISDELSARPILVRILRQIAVSVNAEYAKPDHLLKDGDQVGLLPPVSGGSDQASIPTTYLTREPIVPEMLIENAKKGSDGAVVVFDGIVRDNTRGRSTLYLDYEAYEEMAEKQLAELAQQAIANFGVREVTLVHRLGRLLIGETSVFIVVASAHRGPAYDASRWLIDTLKKTVPIWKKETFVDGVVWAAGEPFPPELAVPAGDLDEDEAHPNDPQAAPEAAV